MTQSGDKKTLRVLIADDDPVVRETFRTFLNGETHELVMAADGAEALELAASLLPDLIFLDVIMPVMDGLEALSQLRRKQKTRRIPVIVVTGKTDTTTLLKALKLGATDFIAKPFLRADLLRKMNFALLNQQQQNKIAEATLIDNKSTFISGDAYYRMRDNFILNFENVYLTMARIISLQDRDELKTLLSRLIDSVKFYQFRGVKEKLLKVLLLIKDDDWEEALETVEEVADIFKELRAALPGREG